MIKLLILTHVHFDHAGSARGLKEASGCRIMVHSAEAERLKAGYAGLPGGTRWKARLLAGLARIFLRNLGRFPALEPDLLVDKAYDLREVGFPGKVIHTPGHTIGSMVVLMEGGELLGGDTFFGLKGKQHFPPFAEDLPALLNSWKSLRSLPVQTIYPGHGQPVPAESFHAEFEMAMNKYGG